MDEIERAGRKRAGADVVPEDLNVRGAGQEPRLQVSGDHESGRTGHVGQPPGDRPSPPADLQAPGVLADFKTLDAPLGQWVRRCSGSSRRRDSSFAECGNA
jgi:hypothetical protein